MYESFEKEFDLKKRIQHPDFDPDDLSKIELRMLKIILAEEMCNRDIFIDHHDPEAIFGLKKFLL